jgi:hypothetical protein
MIFAGNQYADVAELADALDLGSSVFDVGVQVPSSAPNQIPSIDKRNFVNRWFFVCPKVLKLSRFRALCFLPCSNSWCFRIAVIGGYLTRTCGCQVLIFNEQTSGGVHLLTICLVVGSRAELISTLLKNQTIE